MQTCPTSRNFKNDENLFEKKLLIYWKSSLNLRKITPQTHSLLLIYESVPEQKCSAEGCFPHISKSNPQQSSSPEKRDINLIRDLYIDTEVFGSFSDKRYVASKHSAVVPAFTLGFERFKWMEFEDERKFSKAWLSNLKPAWGFPTGLFKITDFGSHNPPPHPLELMIQ